MSVPSVAAYPALPRQGAWIWQVTVLSVVLGVLLALSLRTHHRVSSAGLPPRYNALAERYFDLKAQNQQLSDEMDRSRKELAHYREEVIPKLEVSTRKVGDPSDSRLSTLSKQLERANLFAGLTPVVGTGIQVTLSDSPKWSEMSRRGSPGAANPEMELQRNNFLVHDQDIVGVVNELKTAGAEAIAVNGQRLVANSSIRCAGNICLINRQAVGGGAPYTILAIGSPRDLEAGLKLPGGYLDQQNLSAYDMVKIEALKEVRIPAYKGSIEFQLARPVKPTSESQ